MGSAEPRVTVRCPRGHAFTCAAENLGKRARCPKSGCGVRFTRRLLSDEPSSARDTPCPSCGSKLTSEALVCVACGFNTETGKHIETEAEAESNAGHPWYTEHKGLLVLLIVVAAVSLIMAVALSALELNSHLKILILLSVANVPVYMLIGKALFHGWAEFWECIKFWLTPDIMSLFKGEWEEDWWAEFKLAVFAVACALCVYGEYRVIQGFIVA